MRILIAEDEPEVAKALKVLLEHNRYAVDTVDNGLDALDYAGAGGYDGLVLDIMMPGMDGIAVLRKLREQGSALPVLLLTAKSEVEDRVAGLNAGADDYLPKPFAASELLARVKSLLRRASSYAPDVLSMGQTCLDCNTYLLSCRENSTRLNNKEFQMLELFLRNPRRVFSAEQLMERIWGFDSEAEIDVVWAYIAFLRKKLKQLGADIQIQTIRGAGYTLEVAPWKND